MREKRAKQVVRCLEHMKAFIGETFQRAHDGCIDPATAQLMIWDELADSLGDIERGAFQNVLWLRLSHDEFDVPIPHGKKSIRKRITSIRHEGSPDGAGPSVTYITMKVSDGHEADALVSDLREQMGAQIRSWSYGCHRSSHPHLKRME
jgi:hypothetical protein